MRGVTKTRMDEMLMEQVMAVSSGTSRVCVNEEKYEPAKIRGLPADLVNKGQAREMKDLDDMKVLKWVEESMVPKDAQILDCGTASKDFGDLVADVMKEIQFERGTADPQIYNDTKTNPKHQSCSTLTTQSWQHHINS